MSLFCYPYESVILDVKLESFFISGSFLQSVQQKLEHSFYFNTMSSLEAALRMAAICIYTGKLAAIGECMVLMVHKSLCQDVLFLCTNL